jgi:uncharacterized phage-associated protein
MTDKLIDYEWKKVVQALNYLLRLSDNMSIKKISLVKLLWAADRYHLRNFGRTVTEGKYVAMENGPVLSKAKDILKKETGFGMNSSLVPYIDGYIKTKADDVISVDEVDSDYLAKTDLQALDFAWQSLGTMSSNVDSVVRFTHKYPEWIKYEKALKTSRVQDVDLDLFFEDNGLLSDDPFRVDEARKQLCKDLYHESSAATALLRQ